MIDNDLKIICWNVRGLNSAARREAVRLFMQQARPVIICLQETKLDNVSMQLASEFLGPTWCSSYVFLPAQQTRGGILIAWNQDLFASGTTDKKIFCISQRLTLLQTNIVFMITSVYGPADNDSATRGAFLDELIQCQPPTNLPWICVGDFNLICEAQDKNNDNINRSQMRKFRRALDAS